MTDDDKRCIEEAERIEREKGQIVATKAAQVRTRRAQRWSYAVLGLLLAITVAGFWGVYDFWQGVSLNRSQFIASQAEDQFRKGSDPVTGMLLGLEALPDTASASLVQRILPHESTAEVALDGAWRNRVLRRWKERRPTTRRGCGRPRPASRWRRWPATRASSGRWRSRPTAGWC
jgi:hypothetical protein